MADSRVVKSIPGAADEALMRHFLGFVTLFLSNSKANVDREAERFREMDIVVVEDSLSCVRSID